MARRQQSGEGRLKAAGRLTFATIAAFQKNQCSLMAGGLAYFLLISASPLCVVAVAFIGMILGEEPAQQAALSRVDSIFGAEAAALVARMIQGVDLFSGGVAASIIAILVLFYGSTRAFAALQSALDVIWESPWSGSIRVGVVQILRSRLLAFLMVLALGLLMLVTWTLDAFSATVMKQMGDAIPLGSRLVSSGNRIFLTLLRVACLVIIYRSLPARKISWRDVWPGALLGVVLLSFGHSLIRRYVIYSGVNSAFGAAGSVIALLLSFYYLAFVVLLGAQFAKVYGDQRTARRTAAGDE
jgi:membrane protein